jgi:D-ribose pyranase
MRSNGGILNGQLSRIISETGHTDRIVVSDAGLPIPLGVERVDLALRPGKPTFLDVLDAVLGELAVEAVTLAVEIRDASPELLDQILSRFPEITAQFVTHVELKARTTTARAVLRSGEFTSFANVILTAGVVY